MAVLKSIEKNNQGRPLEMSVAADPRYQDRSQNLNEIKLPKRESLPENITPHQILAETERDRLESLGVLGRLNERTWKSALKHTCNTLESIILVTVVPLAYLISEDASSKSLTAIQNAFDRISPNGSILSNDNNFLNGKSFLENLWKGVSLGFNIVTYPTSVALDLALGVLSTGVEEVDRGVKNAIYGNKPYAEYLKEIEEQPSGLRDALNLLCLVGVSLITLGRGNVPTPIAVRSYKALQLMFPSLAMGLAGATGEQLMRVEDEESRGFNFRALFSDTIQGALGSGLFMLGMKGFKNHSFRNFADMSDGAQDFFDASGEYQRLELANKKISFMGKVARSAGYTLKLGTAVYDLKDTDVLKRVELESMHSKADEVILPPIQEVDLSEVKYESDGFILELPANPEVQKAVIIKLLLSDNGKEYRNLEFLLQNKLISNDVLEHNDIQNAVKDTILRLDAKRDSLLIEILTEDFPFSKAVLEDQRLQDKLLLVTRILYQEGETWYALKATELLSVERRTEIISDPEIRQIAELIFKEGFRVDAGDSLAIYAHRIFNFEQEIVDRHSHKGLYFAFSNLDLDRAVLLINELRPSHTLVLDKLVSLLDSAVDDRKYDLVEKARKLIPCSKEEESNLLELAVLRLNRRRNYSGILTLIAIYQGEQIDTAFTSKIYERSINGLPREIYSLTKILEIAPDNNKQLEEYIADNLIPFIAFIHSKAFEQITREDYLQGQRLNLNLGRVALLKSKGIDLSNLEEASEIETEARCREIFKILRSDDSEFLRRASSMDELENIADNVGYRTLIRYCCKENVVLHDADNGSKFLKRMLLDAGLMKSEEERSSIMRNLLEQITRSKALNGNRNSYVLLINIGFETKGEIRRCWQELIDYRRTGDGSLVDSKLEGINSIEDIFSSWSNMIVFYEAYALYQQKDIQTELGKIRLEIALERDTHKKSAKQALLDYVTTLLGSSVIEFASVAEFLLNPQEFWARRDLAGVTVLSDSLAASELLNTPSQLTAEELRLALVSGVLDRLQLPAMKISYQVNLNEKGIKEIIEDEVLNVASIPTQSREKALVQRKSQLRAALRKLRVSFELQDYLVEGSGELDENIVIELEQLEGNVELKEKLRTIAPNQSNGSLNLFEVEMFLKSDARGALAGNEVADCMPFGSGKDNIFKIYPYAQLTVRYQTNEGHWITISQSVVSLARDLKEEHVAEIDFNKKSAPEAMLKTSGNLIQLDNLEVSHNFRINTLLRTVKNLLADFFFEYQRRFVSEIDLDRKDIIVGAAHTPSNIFSVRPNTTLQLIIPSYTDNNREDSYFFTPRQVSGINKKVEVRQKDKSKQYASSEVANVEPLTLWDSTAISVIEELAHQDNPTKMEHLPALQNRLVASVIANELRGQANFSFKYVNDQIDKIEGYLLAYASPSFFGKEAIFIDDVCALSDLATQSLLEEFIRAYEREYLYKDKHPNLVLRKSGKVDEQVVSALLKNFSTITNSEIEVKEESQGDEIFLNIKITPSKFNGLLNAARSASEHRIMHEIMNLQREGAEIPAWVLTEVTRGYFISAVMKQRLSNEIADRCVLRLSSTTNVYDTIFEILAEFNLNKIDIRDIVKIIAGQLHNSHYDQGSKYDEMLFRGCIGDFKSPISEVLLNNRYRYESFLGMGVEGVVFKVVDIYSNETRVLKFCFAGIVEDAKEWKDILSGRKRVVEIFDAGNIENTKFDWVLREYVDYPHFFHRLTFSEVVSKLDPLPLLRSYLQSLDEVHELVILGILPSDLQYFVDSATGNVKLFDYGFWSFSPKRGDSRKPIYKNGGWEFAGFEDSTVYTKQFMEIFKSVYQRISEKELNAEVVAEMLQLIEKLKNSPMNQIPQIFDLRVYLSSFEILISQLVAGEGKSLEKIREVHDRLPSPYRLDFSDPLIRSTEELWKQIEHLPSEEKKLLSELDNSGLNKSLEAYEMMHENGHRFSEDFTSIFIPRFTCKYVAESSLSPSEKESLIARIAGKENIVDIYYSDLNENQRSELRKVLSVYCGKHLEAREIEELLFRHYAELERAERPILQGGFEFVKYLGAGKEGIVFEVRERDKDRYLHYAVKFMDRDRAERALQFMELFADSSFILNNYYVGTTSKHTYIVKQLLLGEEVDHKAIKKCFKEASPFDSNNSLLTLLNVIHHLKFLETQKVFAGDLQFFVEFLGDTINVTFFDFGEWLLDVELENMDFDEMEKFTVTMNEIISEFIKFSLLKNSQSNTSASEGINTEIEAMLGQLRAMNLNIWDYDFNSVVNFIDAIYQMYQNRDLTNSKMNEIWNQLPFLLKWRLKQFAQVRNFLLNMGIQLD